MKIQGIFLVTGEFGAGKTLFSLGAAYPNKTAYFHDDVKMPPVDPKDFGLYVNLIDKYKGLSNGLKMLEYYDAIVSEIEDIEPGKFDSIVFDTWGTLGQSIRYFAKANPYRFREQETFSRQGTIKHMEFWKQAHEIESFAVAEIARKAPAIFFIVHIKPVVKGGVSTDLNQPDHGKAFNKVANVKIWLQHNPDSPVPIGLVLKRPAKVMITKDGMESVNLLPQKLTPQPDDTSLWDVIKRYYDNPMGNRKPEPHEQPTPDEIAILSGTLTKRQLELWRAGLEQQRQQDKFEQEIIAARQDEFQAAVQKAAGSIAGPPPLKAAKVLEQLQQDWPEFSLDVKKVLRG